MIDDPYVRQPSLSPFPSRPEPTTEKKPESPQLPTPDYSNTRLSHLTLQDAFYIVVGFGVGWALAKIFLF